jgi:hypothetical protein
MSRFLPVLLVAGLLAGNALHAQETFTKAKLNLQVGEKKKEVDSSLKYTDAALLITDKKTGVTIKTFPYEAIKTMEYSYSKSPRWKSAIFVSPLFLFTSGKKHWLAVQGSNDYAVMQLDKTNFKLILAALETKTGKKIETLEDSK